MATSGDEAFREEDRAIRDEDRLPWLETVDDDDDSASTMRIFLFVLLGLAIIAAAILGYYWYHDRAAAGGDGTLIAAQEGDYKVKPDDPGGMNVQGEGDTAIATSDGAASGNASINMAAAPEAPVAGHKAPAAPAPAGGRTVVAMLPGAGGGSLVQLGSYPDASAADAAWASVSRRFGDLARLGNSVQSASVNGRTMYRLRVDAGGAGQAAALCGKLKAAGQACFVPVS